MKLTFTVLLLLAFSFCGNKKSVVEPKPDIKTIIKAVYGQAKENRSVLVEVKLINNSNSIIEFLTMTCGTADNLVFEPRDVYARANNCSGNHLTTIKLNPKQEFSLVTLLEFEKYYPEYLKVGWILLDYENTKSPRDYHDVVFRGKEKLENIIWSEPVELYCCNAHPYDIR